MVHNVEWQILCGLKQYWPTWISKTVTGTSGQKRWNTRYLKSEHSENSRSREFSWELGSFFLARPREISLHISFPSRNMRLWKKISRSRLEPWNVEIKISLSSRTLRCWENKSRSRLELWDLENKILVLVSNLEIERHKISKSKRTAFHWLVLFARQW